MSKASTDKTIKASLKSHPGAALNEICTDVPDDVKIAVIEDSPNAVNLVLPAAKREGQL